MGIILNKFRKEILKYLYQCAPEQQLMFKRMYSHKNMDATLEEAVNNMSDEKLNTAAYQIERTLNQKNGASEMQIVKTMREFAKTEEKFHTYFHPRLMKLLRQDKLGQWPSDRKDLENVVAVTSFELTNTNDIKVGYSIHWSGDVYDNESIIMSPQQWEDLAK